MSIPSSEDTTPIPASECVHPSGTKGEDTLACVWGGVEGGSQFGQLEEKLSILPTLHAGKGVGVLHNGKGSSYILLRQKYYLDGEWYRRGC